MTITTRFRCSPVGLLLVGIAAALFSAGCGSAIWGGVGSKETAASKVEQEGTHDKNARNEDARGDGEKKDDEKKDPEKDGEKKDGAGDEKKEEAAPAKVDVRCATARRLPFATTIDGLGRTEPLPECVGSLTAAVEGHVHELLVKIGDPVKAHQPILQLDPTVAKATLAEKVANRDSLIAARKLLESLPRPEERRAAELAVEQAKISVEHDKLQVESLRELLAHNDVSKKAFHDAEVLLKQAEVTLQTAEAQLKLLMTGPRPEAVAEAQTKIQMADEAIASSRATLDLHTLRAPIAGVVESLHCHPGQTLTIGTPVGEVIDIRQVFVTIYFPARITRLLQPGMVAKVDLSDGARPAGESEAKDKDEKKDTESAAKDKDKEKDGEKVKGDKDQNDKDKGDKNKDEKDKETLDVVSGKVAFIANSADPQTGNYAVRILMDNQGGRLRLGQVVRVNVQLKNEESQLAVPEAAIFDQGEGPTLAVVREGKLKLLHPELGTSQGGNVAVAKTDLKEGEPVVIEGAYSVPDGTEANILPEVPKAAAPAEAKEPADAKAANESKDEAHEKTPAKGGARE